MYCQKHGCCIQNILPEQSTYFKEEIVCEILTIPSAKPDMERLLNVMVWPEIEDYHLIETQVGKSNEGQYLSGQKLVVEVRLKEKLTYVADEPTQTVHAAHFENLKSMFVILPESINGVPMCDLVNGGRVSINPYVEAVESRMMDKRTVHKCVMLFLDVKIC